MPHVLSAAFMTLVCLSYFGISNTSNAKDIVGGKDHPMVTRFAGAEMQGYGAVDFDDVT